MNASISISAPVLKPLQTLQDRVLRHERALSIVGLLLVPLMIALFYVVLIDQQAQMRQARDQAMRHAAQDADRCSVAGTARQARAGCTLALQTP